MNDESLPPEISDATADRRRSTRDWSWWNNLLQRRYYASPSQRMGWDVAAADVAIKATVSPGTSVLELGSGAGELLMRLALRGADVTGVEASEPLVKACRKRALDRGVPATFIHDDMFDFTSDEEFQTILSVNTSFGYGTDVQNRLLIEKIGSWLSPGGRFYLDLVVADNASELGVWSDMLDDGLLCVENRYDSENRQMRSWPYFIPKSSDVYFAAERPEVVRLYSAEELTGMMQKAGLEVKRLKRGLGRRSDRSGPNLIGTWLAVRPV